MFKKYIEKLVKEHTLEIRAKLIGCLDMITDLQYENRKLKMEIEELKKCQTLQK